MPVDNGRRIIDQDATLTIYPEDQIIIDSTTNGTRKISYEALCAAVAVTLGITDISQKANGAMQRSVYDADGDNVVDNAEALGGHAASYFATQSDMTAVETVAAGAMQKSVYDSDGDGVVDDAEALGGNAPSYYATQQSVNTLSGQLAGKMDTATYDSTGNGVVDNAEKVNNHTVDKDVPSNAQFTDTVYDDTALQAKVGDLSNLNTTNKTSLVAAINEVHDDADIHLSVVNGQLMVTFQE